MQLRYLAARVASLVLFVIFGSLLLQPTTLHAASTSGETITSTEPPSTLAPNVVPEVYQGSYRYTTTADMLSALGVSLSPQDIVTAFPDPSLGIGSQLKVYRAPTITIDDGGNTYQVQSWAQTVGDLVTEQRLNLASQDQTSSPLTTSLSSIKELAITRVSVATLTTTTPIAYTIQNVNDPSLDKGVKQVQQSGQNGLLQETYSVTRQNGVETSRALIGSEVLKPATPEIVAIGTMITNYGSGGASWYSFNGIQPLTAANKTLPKGTKVNVVNLANGKSVIVTIDDRGPYVGGRVIDLSPDAFAQIASLGTGVVQVRMDKVY